MCARWGSDEIRVAKSLRVALMFAAEVALVLSVLMLTSCGGSSSSSNASAAFDRTFTRDNWAELDADPDAFEGAWLNIVGEVLGEPVKDGDSTYWQMWPHPTNVDWLAVVEFEDPSFTIADGDCVRVLGTVRGTAEGKIPFLATLDAVAVRAETAEVVDRDALAPPALRTVEVAQSVDQHRLVVTVDKVEFAANETRVYVTVSNQSAATAMFNGYKARAIQGQTQYAPEDLTYYPWVEPELPPAASSSGVILFRALDPLQATKLSLEPRTDDYQLKFTPYAFAIAGK